MANTLAPFGFKWVGRLDGASPNAGLVQRQVLTSAVTTGIDSTFTIFFGDPVTITKSGYMVRTDKLTGITGENPPATTQINGIFYGCKWYSPSQQRIINSNWWPATSDFSGLVQCNIVSEPLSVFVVQSSGASFQQADIDGNIGYVVGTGNTASGLSGASVTPAAATTTSTLPFRIYDVYRETIGNGGDLTTNFAYVYVTFNNQDYKTLTGITV